MRFDFTGAEVADLYEAVEVHHKQLLFELAKADDRAYQAMLRDKCRRCEALMKRIDAASAEAIEITPYV